MERPAVHDIPAAVKLKSVVDIASPTVDDSVVVSDPIVDKSPSFSPAVDPDLDLDVSKADDVLGSPGLMWRIILCLSVHQISNRRILYNRKQNLQAVGVPNGIERRRRGVIPPLLLLNEVIFLEYQGIKRSPETTSCPNIC